MNDRLSDITRTVVSNIDSGSKIYMLDNMAAHIAYAITLADMEPDSGKVAQAKKIADKNAGLLSAMGGNAPKMLAIAKMVRGDQPEETYGKIRENFDLLKKALSENYFIGVAAALLPDPDIGKITELYKLMSKKHFLGLGYKDRMVVALMARSNKSAADMVSEADSIYAAVKKEFGIISDDGYTVSYLLAASDEPVEWKIKTLVALKKDLKDQKVRLSSYSTASILAPLTIAALTIDRSILINEILEADSFFAAQKGIGGIFGLSTDIRQMLAAACVLKAYTENEDTEFSEAGYLTAMACQCKIKSDEDASTTAVITSV